ncbi:MAG: hypothetical protein ACERKO_02645 [Acetanaerobacterium sp.]
MNYSPRIATLALVLLLAGCGVPPANKTPEPALDANVPLQEAAEHTELLHFSIDLGSRTPWVVDYDGNTVPEERQFRVLYDQGNGQPQCQILTRVEGTGQKNKYDQPITRTLCALYDMDGTLLYDWDEVSYKEGFGDYILRRDTMTPFDEMEPEGLPANFYTTLWNYKTDTIYMEGIFSLQNMDNNSFLASTVRNKAIGVLDREGSKLGGFPTPKDYFYSTPWNGYIIASTREPNHPKPHTEISLMTVDFQPLFSRTSARAALYGRDEGGLIFRDLTTESILSVPDGDTVFSVEPKDWIQYFDGECGTIRRDMSDGDSDYFVRRLVNAKGETLADGYDTILSAPQDSVQAAAQYFVGLRGESIDHLDRTGTVVSSVQLPGITALYSIGYGLYSYTVNNEYAGLLDSDFMVIIPADTYNSISCASYWNREKRLTYPILQAYRSVNDQITRIDILDFTGKKIITNLSRVFAFGPDRIAVIRGFEAGLMDWQGNWIAKSSLFTQLDKD